jgi:hypothetical protein
VRSALRAAMPVVTFWGMPRVFKKRGTAYGQRQ